MSVVICWELGKNDVKFTVTFWAVLGLRGYHTALLVEWFPQFPTKCIVFVISRTTCPKLCSLVCGISLKTWYRRHFLKTFFASYYVLHHFFFFTCIGLSYHYIRVNCAGAVATQTCIRLVMRMTR